MTARALALLLIGVGLALLASCERAPIEPLEPITEEDLRLPRRKPPPGQIVEIPLERELDPDRVRAPVEDVPVGPAWLVESGVDRPRGDYRFLGGEDLALRHCKAACAREAQCVAFTYGHRSGERQVFCALKYRLTDPEPCGRCTSGVKP